MVRALFFMNAASASDANVDGYKSVHGDHPLACLQQEWGAILHVVAEALGVSCLADLPEDHPDVMKIVSLMNKVGNPAVCGLCHLHRVRALHLTDPWHSHHSAQCFSAEQQNSV